MYFLKEISRKWGLTDMTVVIEEEEKRTNPRHKILWRIVDDKGKILGFISDISERGGRINLIRNINTHPNFHFYIEPYNSFNLPKVPVEAEIMWALGDEYNLKSTLGVRFHFKENSHLKKMRKLIHYIETYLK